MAGRKNRDTKTRSLFSSNQPNRPVTEPFVPGPNPKLHAFIKEHATSYNPAKDNYDVGPFTKDIVVNKAIPPKAIYDMHAYWSKKHWSAIREYLRHYLPPKYYPKGTGLVLDCFSGSGMTGVASIMENRPCILLDASPAASFISHCYTHPADPAELQAAFDAMMEKEYAVDLKKKLKKIAGLDILNLQQELDWLYGTKCDRCGGLAVTEYVVHSQTFACPNCGEHVPLFDCQKIMVRLSDGKEKMQTVCPTCLKRCHGASPERYIISTRDKKQGEVPVRVSYICQNNCRPKRDWRNHDDKQRKKSECFKKFDLSKIEQLKRVDSPHNIPKDHFTKGFIYYRDGLHLRDVTNVVDLFSLRNAWALSAISEAIDGSNCQHLKVSLSATVLGVSRLIRNRATGGGFTAGSYSIPAVNKELYAPEAFATKFKTQLLACEHLREIDESGRLAIVSNELSQKTEWSPDTLDFVFTDPPYSAKGGQYAELNEVWRCWLGLPKDNFDEEVCVNPKRGLSLDTWVARLRMIFEKVFVALKPGRWAAICYHDISDKSWQLFQDVLLDVGFEIHSVTVLDPLQKSANQINAEKVVKSDLVINCRKPKQGETQRMDSETGRISQRVRDIMVETLAAQGGQSRDKLWDVVLKRLLTRGQMAEHRFDDILAEVATHTEGGRWYLKDEFQQLSEDDLKNEEHAGESLVRFARLRCIGVPAKYAASLASDFTALCKADDRGRLDEGALEKWINGNLHADDKLTMAKTKNKRLELGGRLVGMEFYDALFFYLTKYMKNRRNDQLPKRNLTDFLEEYLVRFADGDKWLYRAPFGSEETDMRKARQSGLGRRIRAYSNALRENDRDYTDKHRPDAKTFVEWMRYCAAYGHYEDGATLYDQGGLTVDELQRVIIDEKEEETAYDAARGFADLCKRRIKKTAAEDETEAETEDGEE